MVLHCTTVQTSSEIFSLFFFFLGPLLPLSNCGDVADRLSRRGGSSRIGTAWRLEHSNYTQSMFSEPSYDDGRRRVRAGKKFC